MRQFLFLLTICCFAASPISAQSKKELAAMLNRDLGQYKHYSLNAKFDSVFQYTPDEMFDIISKDSLIAMMNKAMNNEYMDISLTRFDFKDKPKIKKAGAYFWTLVSYDGGMVIHFKGEKNLGALMVSMMKSKFGDENTKELEDGGLQITMPNKKMIAFKEPADTHWYFIEDKRDDKENAGEMDEFVFKAVVPEAVRKALDKK